MGKNKRKNFTPSALREIEDELRIVKSLNYRDIVWKAGDLVSVIEDDVEYYAQESLILFALFVVRTLSIYAKIRGVVLQRLQLPGAIIRWLIPNPENDHCNGYKILLEIVIFKSKTSMLPSI